MDVITSVPSLDKVITRKVLPNGLIDVKGTHEAWKNSKTPLATETDVLQAVKQDPAVLEAQLCQDSVGLQGASRSNAGGPFAAFVRPDNGPPSVSNFERLAGQQQQALQSLAPEQLALLMRYVGTLRRQRHAVQRTLECAFCKNNGESLAWYTQHALKDWRGRVLCPVLRAFRCPRCGATGDRAHTIKYCPENSDADRWSPGF